MPRITFSKALQLIFQMNIIMHVVAGCLQLKLHATALFILHVVIMCNNIYIHIAIFHILFMYTKAIATYTCQGWHLLVGDYGRHLTISLTDL